jgi:hypothetical protein
MLCESCADFIPRTLAEKCSLEHPIEQLFSCPTATCPLCRHLQDRFLPVSADVDDGKPSPSVKLNWMRNGASYKVVQARGQHSWHSPMDLRLLHSFSVWSTDKEPINPPDGDKLMTNYTAGGVDRGVNWLRECLARHPACVPTRGIKRLPRRLLFVGNDNADTTPRLVETTSSQPDLRYMTLSHSWGTQRIFQLTTDNYAALLLQIPVSHLQQVFRDAISVTRKAAVEYLWIDSLCIIQDSVEDWRHESMNMGMIYSGAVCNIAATGFTDGLNGLFVKRDATLAMPIHVHLNADITACDGAIFAQGDYHLVDSFLWVDGVEHAPLNKRGWVVQERFLSPRVMHFGSRQSFWECRTLEASEAFPEGLPREVFTSKVKKSIHIDHRKPEKIGDSNRWNVNRWPTAVMAYSRSKLTFKSDKMIAIAGLAKSLQHPFMGSYLGGMWSNFLLSHLTWSTVPFELGRRPSAYRCPSWSWASVDTGVDMPLVPSGLDLRRLFLASVCEAEITPLDSDRFGTLRAGWIRVLCPLLCVKLIQGENTATETSPTAEAIHISFTTLSIQMDVQDDHSDEFTEALTVSKALKVINFRDDGFTSSPEGVHDFLIAIEKRTGDTSSITGLRLKGLLVRPTLRRRGEFERVGMFNSESLEAIELLEKSSQTLPASVYEKKGLDGRYQICLV